MAKNKMKPNSNKSYLDTEVMNDLTFIDYLNRLRKIAISIFEWVNLPSSMNAQKLEKDLFYNGMATILKDEEMGFINTNCCSNGYINIYDLPTAFNCYSHQYSKSRKLYTRN